jgi:hypothetical protein
MKHRPAHKPRRPLLRRKLATMCATRRARIEYDVRRSHTRICELTIDLTDDLPDWHPDSNQYQGP